MCDDQGIYFWEVFADYRADHVAWPLGWVEAADANASVF